MSDKRPDGLTGGRSDPDVPGDRRGQLVAEWARTLAKTSHVPMSWAEILRLLGHLAGRVADIGCGTPFHPRAAQAVGAALVGAHFVGFEAPGPRLTAVVQILRETLASDPQPDSGARLGARQQR